MLGISRYHLVFLTCLFLGLEAATNPKKKKRAEQADSSSDDYETESSTGSSATGDSETESSDELEIDVVNHSSMPEPWSLDCESFGTVYLFKRVFSVCHSPYLL
jgi:hypothetical protein